MLKRKRNRPGLVFLPDPYHDNTEYDFISFGDVDNRWMQCFILLYSENYLKVSDIISREGVMIIIMVMIRMKCDDYIV